MSGLVAFQHGFEKHEEAIEALWTLYEKVNETLNDYASEELNATQAMHILLAVAGKWDDRIKYSVAKAVAESAMASVWRADELAEELITAAIHYTRSRG